MVWWLALWMSDLNICDSRPILCTRNFTSLCCFSSRGKHYFIYWYQLTCSFSNRSEALAYNPGPKCSMNWKLYPVDNCLSMNKIIISRSTFCQLSHDLSTGYGVCLLFEQGQGGSNPPIYVMLQKLVNLWLCGWPVPYLSSDYLLHEKLVTRVCFY